MCTAGHPYETVVGGEVLMKFIAVDKLV